MTADRAPSRSPARRPRACRSGRAAPGRASSGPAASVDRRSGSPAPRPWKARVTVAPATGLPVSGSVTMPVIRAGRRRGRAAVAKLAPRRGVVAAEGAGEEAHARACANTFQISSWCRPPKTAVSATRIALRLSRNDGLCGRELHGPGHQRLGDPASRARSRRSHRVCAQISPSECTSGPPITWP